MILDLKIYYTKELLLNHLVKIIEEMYSPNYDALIDSLKFYDKTIIIKNIKYYNDLNNLIEILQIIKDNNIQIIYVDE